MSEINVEVGKRIHNFRKNRKMTLDELSAIVFKSKSTLSKYEKGEISVDVETLYDLADALHIHVEQLLYNRPVQERAALDEISPAFFKGLTRFYSYLYDGRSRRLMRCAFDVLSKVEHNKYKIMMYMNFNDYKNYQQCENTYWGYIEHYDALTVIEVTNQDTPMEKASIQILASYLDSEIKWGLFNGVSSRPMMPIAIKMLFSKKPLNEDDELINKLKVSKEDIGLLKLYNMFSVT